MAQTNLQKILGTLFGIGEAPQSLADYAAGTDPTGETDFIQLNLSDYQPAAEITATEKMPAGAETKSLDDITGSGLTVIDLGGTGPLSQMERKLDVELLRNYAKYSVWVRAAIDYHRRMLGRAHYEIVPIDSTVNLNRRDKQSKAAIETLLRHPNAADESYSTIKEQMVEDYLVIGHGCVEMNLNRDLTARGLRIMDAARIGFVKAWDGTDKEIPRFVEFADKYGARISRFLAHEQVMCLVNRPMSNRKLGHSHVEALHRSVLALLSGDEFLIKQILQPIPDTLVNLGEGVTKQQVEQFKYQIQQVREKLAIVGGAKSPSVMRLSASADEMKILDGQIWFVRQVAAIFGMSTAKLKLSVDTSRANTQEMNSDDLEAITGELTRIEELENSTFINRLSYLGDINLQFSYPILHRKDEFNQARIARLQMGSQIGWISPNESRTRTGEKPLEKLLYVDEPIIQTKDGPLPWSIWVKNVQEFEKNIGKNPDTQDPANDGNMPAEPDDNDSAEDGDDGEKQ